MGSPRVKRTGPEDEQTNAGSKWKLRFILRDTKKNIYIQDGPPWPDTSVKDLKGKVVLCRRKRRRERDREKEPEGVTARKRGRDGERGGDGRKGSESTTRGACFTGASEISCYRLSSVFRVSLPLLFFLPSSLPPFSTTPLI